MNKDLYYILANTQDLSKGPSFEMWSATFWMTIVAALVLMLIGGLFIWIYYRQKNSHEFYEQNKHRSWGSIKGYWARYRGAVYAFLAAMFIIIGILMFFWAVGWIDPTTELN